ncbi:MAG: hypothetical protein LCH89_00360 [Proteobacteria bacterium]|nr:hypothetical protein [Pseudomonadota bacterium]
MCEPALISAGLSIAGTALGVNAQARAASAQNEAINKATVDNYSALNRQGVEDRENASVEQTKIKNDTESRTASARAAAAGAEVGGLSVDALLLDLAGKGLEAGTTSDINYTRSAQARADQAEALRRGAVSQKAAIRDVGVAEYLGAGLQIANTGLNYVNKRKAARGGI